MASNPQQNPHSHPKPKPNDPNHPKFKHPNPKHPNPKNPNAKSHPFNPNKDKPHFYKKNEAKAGDENFVMVPKPNRPYNNRPRNNNQSTSAQSTSAQSTSDQPSSMMAEVLSTLECPVCLNHMSSPIFMCETGHNICGSCLERMLVPACPLCGVMITDKRNFGLEAIAAKMGVPCENASKGCKFVNVPDQLKIHLEKCKFNDLTCPIGMIFKLCTWKGPKKEIKSHFSQMHLDNMKLKFASEVTFVDFDIKKNDYNLQLLEFQNNYFLYHVKIDVFQNLAFWVIQYIGTDQEAENWCYEFNFYIPKKPKKIISFKEPCQSDSVSIDTIFSSGKCVVIPLIVLKNYVEENDNKLTFKFYIRNQKQNPRFPNFKQVENATNEIFKEYEGNNAD